MSASATTKVKIVQKDWVKYFAFRSRLISDVTQHLMMFTPIYYISS